MPRQFLNTKDFNEKATYDYLTQKLIYEKCRKQDIAEEIGCSKERLNKRLKDLGIYRNPLPATGSNRTKDLIDAGFKVLSTYKSCNHHILLECFCGNTFYTVPYKIFSKHTKSCGCLRLSNKFNFIGYEDIQGCFFSVLKKNADNRNLFFSITLKDIWDIYLKQNMLCALSKLPIYFGKKGKTITTVSVDRIDSSKGYEIDNIQLIHKHINRMKVTHSQDYFIYLCSLVGKNSYISDNFKQWEIDGGSSMRYNENTKVELTQKCILEKRRKIKENLEKELAE